jgi:hypothetical protein
MKSEWEIEWCEDGTVTFPPAGDSNPNGMSFTQITDDDDFHRVIDGSDVHELKYAAAMFARHPPGTKRIQVPLALIPRPDNPVDPYTVSVAVPKSMGGDVTERHLGYLYRQTIGYWVEDCDDRRDVIARIADFGGGEIECFGFMTRGDCCSPFDLIDYDDPRTFRCDLPPHRHYIDGFQLDLPLVQVVGEGILDFLVGAVDPDFFGQDLDDD